MDSYDLDLIVSTVSLARASKTPLHIYVAEDIERTRESFKQATQRAHEASSTGKVRMAEAYAKQADRLHRSLRAMRRLRDEYASWQQ